MGFPLGSPTGVYTRSEKDFNDLRSVFSASPPYFRSSGNTDIGSAIELARYQLEQIPNPGLRPLEMIVLLSDGQANHSLFRLRGSLGNIPSTNPGPHRGSGKNYFLHEWESGWNFDHIASLPNPKDGLNPEGMYPFFGYRLFKPDHTPLSGEKCLAYVALPSNIPAGTYHTFLGWSKICLYRPGAPVDRDACDLGSYDNWGGYEGSNRCCVANQPSNPNITIGKPGGGNLASNIPITRKNIRALIVEQTIAEADYARQRDMILVVGATDFVDDASKLDPNEARYASNVNAIFLRRLAADPAAVEVGDPDYQWVSDVEAQVSTGNAGAFIHADYMQGVYTLANSIFGKLRVVLYE